MSERSINFPGLVKGMIASVLLTFIFLLGICCLCYFLTVSEQVLSLLVFLATGISVLVGAFLASRKAVASGLFHGLLLGIGYLFVVWIWGTVANGSFFFNTHLLSMVLCILATGMLGGIFGINLQK